MASRCLRVAVAVLALAPVFTLNPALAKQDDPSGKDKARSTSSKSDDASHKADEQKDVDTEHLFGFTEGSDAGEKGQQEIVVDTVSRLGKRREGAGTSTYRVLDTRLGYQFDPIDRMSIEFSVYGDLRRVRNIVDLDDKSFGAFDGVSLDAKYQFLKGSAEQPVGLAVEVRPRFTRILPIEGNGANVFDIETLLQLDVQIVPNKLWYGSNLSFEPAAGRQRGSGQGYRSSAFLWSNAVVGEVAKDTYLGPEIRYVRGYDGTFLNALQSEAVYLGPALHHRFTEKIWLTLAYAGQVWGHDTDPGIRRRPLGLNQFERQNLRVKFGMEF